MIRKIVAALFVLTLNPVAAIGANLTSDVAKHLTSPDPKERYIACLVLGELALESETENRLRSQFKQKQKSFDELCLAYVLAKRTQERIYQENFVKLYPLKDHLPNIAKLHTDTGYPFSVLPPFTRYLADIATTNDEALRKLVSILSTADGAYADSLVDVFASLYKANPNRISKALRGTSANTYLDLIGKTAAQKGKCHE